MKTTKQQNAEIKAWTSNSQEMIRQAFTEGAKPDLPTSLRTLAKICREQHAVKTVADLAKSDQQWLRGMLEATNEATAAIKALLAPGPAMASDVERRALQTRHLRRQAASRAARLRGQ